MLKDITLGQYFPGKSTLHTLDSRVKICCALLLIVSVFLCHSLLSYALLVLGMGVLIALSGIRASVLLKGLKPIVFIAAFTAIINLFWVTGTTPLCSFGIITIYPEGVYSAVFMLTRIVALVLGSTVLLTYTTSPMALTDALERLLKPLAKIKVPVHEFAMMMTIALRFVPTLVTETDKIICAQKARGADFESGNLLRRAKALIPVLIPLFVCAFRRADELAVAMECRCYHGGEGRTRMKVLHAKPSDLFVLFAFLAFGVALFFANDLSAAFGLFVL
ncbi:MAG: energy-coupling factor transporter transmembrane protein EcfT [Clostridia bacterium]|nr:energy-coupling factor transporter transmembrane protein EcfT [Clostridia bacterium]